MFGRRRRLGPRTVEEIKEQHNKDLRNWLIGGTLFIIAAAIFLIVTEQPQTVFRRLEARNTAMDYIREKYKDYPHLRHVKDIYSGGFMFDKGTVCGELVVFDDFEVIVLGDITADNRQYDEITQAITEKYLTMDEIYSEYSVQSAAVDFGLNVSGTDYGEYTSEYYGGDISEFLSRTNPQLTIKLDGKGLGDNAEEVRENIPKLLSDRLAQIYNSTAGDLRVYAYVSDPEADLPDMPLEAHHSSLKFPPKKYDEYMELIAAGSIIRSNDNVDAIIQQPRFYTIDEYTAISDTDFTTPVTSDKDFFLTQKDFSENTTVYRGKYKYYSEAEKNMLTIRENGLYCGLNHSSRHDFILRLDREHYDINDNTIALRVTPPVTAEEWLGKQLYVSMGYDGYDCDLDHWYYMDDKYLYLYVPHLCSDLFGFEDENGINIAFADIDGLNAAP